MSMDCHETQGLASFLETSRWYLSIDLDDETSDHCDPLQHVETEEKDSMPLSQVFS